MFNFFANLLSNRRLTSAVVAAGPNEESPSQVIIAADEANNTEGLVVFRHAVLNRDKKVTGYEFSQAGGHGTEKSDAKRDQALLHYVENAGAISSIGGRCAFAVISSRLLFDPLLERLSRAGVVGLFRFNPATEDMPLLSERMQAMRRDGIVLGLADARLAAENPAIGSAASVGFLPVDQIIPPDLLQMVRRITAQYPHMQLGASGVETYEEFEVCRRLGMHYFIGPFVTHRKDWQSNSVDPGAVRLCRIMNHIRQGAELDAIVDEIKLDPLLSYRILGYANSAAIGAERKILAIKDAIEHSYVVRYFHR